MNTLTMRQETYSKLKEHLLQSDGKEHAGYLVCRHVLIEQDPWTGDTHNKYLVTDFLAVEETDVVRSTESGITWQTNSVVQALNKALQADSILLVAHSHPQGLAEFSTVDDSNESNLARLLQNKLGEGAYLLSLIMTDKEEMVGRVVLGNGRFEPIELIKVIGDRFQIRYPGRGTGIIPEEFERQVRLFGESLTEDLRQLRIGVVGAGGTGGPTINFLTRMGARNLLQIDKDVIGRTNLNRMPNATIFDVGKPKVEVIKAALEGIGFDTSIIVIRAWLNDPACRAALKSCDVIFGCTDDNHGRMLLNRLAYYYLIPVIDMGLLIRPTEDKTSFSAFDGRVNVLVPGHACLNCHRVINPKRAYEEDIERTDPTRYQSLKDEAYVIGGGVSDPVVMTFTSEVASMAVNELIHRLSGFRVQLSAAGQRVRRFDRIEADRIRGANKDGCRICDNPLIWGKGDTEQFLDMTG